MSTPKSPVTRKPLKISLTLSVFFFCSAAFGQGKYRAGQYPVNQNPKDYTIKVHIFATHFRPCDPEIMQCYQAVYADAVLNGKKVELSGPVDKRQLNLISPGDYTAMLPPKDRLGASTVLFQGYYVLLPNKTAWPCQITGFFE